MQPHRKSPLKPKLPAHSHVIVVGLGGVGSIVARYAAVFLASFHKHCVLGLIDGDHFEPSNASRMLFGRCGNKAKVVKQELGPRFRNSKLLLVDQHSYLTPKNIKGVIRSGDIVLLCVDNHKTRQLVDDHCAKLKNITLISGGNDGVEGGRRGTYGNVQLHIRRKGKGLTHSLSAFHPEIAHPTDKRPDERSCTELVLSTPQILFSNLAVASAMLNALLLHLSGQTHYSELSFDIAEGLMRPTLGVKK